LSEGRLRATFVGGFLAGLVALAFNFLLRLGGLVPFPPESALTAFLSVIPASIEEPAVQQFGDAAGELGLVVATLIAAAVYALLLLGFERLVPSTRMNSLTKFERLLVFSLVPWAFFGLLVFPLDGDAFFGAGSAFASSGMTWLFPFTLLLVQSVFAYSALPAYHVQPSAQTDASRRSFIEKGAIGFLALVAGIASLGGLGSLFSSSQIEATGGSQPVDLADAPPIFSDPRLAQLVDSEITPNANFYRVAIDVFDPSIDASSWSLMVDGFVGAPKNYSLGEIKALPVAEQYTTFECVSNDVNGGLIGNAKWTGVKVSDLLEDAGGVETGAEYVVFYSKDGYSVGIPLGKAMEPDSMLAYEMNDQTLPVKHGYPLRGVIPGLYGMMSAKWATRVSVVNSSYLGYWQTRGWTNNAVINTGTFLLMPSNDSTVSLSGGSVILAGYAFAGDRGISKVEVSFDGGKTWQTAQLKPSISGDTWALWAFEWQPSPGKYTIVARSTDGTGQVQAEAQTNNYPKGATGYVYASVTVVS
jgi:DMSO/TMAO reductase YedYZ molybdopterin-dependent catalytic subunit